jgi:hypothetical protein
VYNILGWFTDIHYQDRENVYRMPVEEPKPVVESGTFLNPQASGKIINGKGMALGHPLHYKINRKYKIEVSGSKKIRKANIKCFLWSLIFVIWNFYLLSPSASVP